MYASMRGGRWSSQVSSGMCCMWVDRSMCVCAVQLLNQPIRLWVVGGGSCLVDPQEMTELCKQVGLKVPSLVTLDGIRSSKAADPLTE